MITNQLVEKASRKAQGAQAILRQIESTEVSFESDKLKAAQSSQSTEIEVKVIADGKIGISSTTDIHDLDGVVDRALQSAEFGNQAHFQFPGPGQGADVEVFDEALPPVTKPEMIQIGEDMMGLVKEYRSDILSEEVNIGKSISRSEFANSSGTEFAGESTSFGLWFEGQLVRDTDILSVWHGLERRNRDIDHAVIARKVIERFRMAENIAPIHSGDMPVILTPDGVAVLLMTLTLALDGKNALLGSSPLAGKLGQRITDERFSLVDNPLIDYAANSSKYDGEGVPRQVTPLIEKGLLKHFLYDLDTAGRAGVETTGHGADREPTNLLIKPGDAPYGEMVKGIRKGLLVHSVMGLGQGNPISGEFSVNVLLGYKIENGEVVGRVKDVMLAGNVFDALNDIVAIGDDAEWIGGWFGGSFPHVQVGKLSVVTR